jgi:hypothetical protein
MPLFMCEDLHGHVTEVFAHHPLDLRTVICEVCQSTMARVLSMGRGLTYFSEKSGQWIYNLGDQPVYITSHEQHRAEMRKAGVDWATERATKGSGGWI